MLLGLIAWLPVQVSIDTTRWLRYCHQVDRVSRP